MGVDINLSKNGGIYRIVDIVFVSSPSKNVCILFWQFLFAFLFVFMVGLIAATLLLAPVFYLVVGLIHGFHADFIFNHPAGLLVFVGLLFYGFVMACIVTILFYLAHRRISHKTGIHKSETLRLFGGYVSGKMKKVCPRVNWIS